MPDCPLILLDVDGVLNPIVRPGLEWQRHKAAAGSGSFNVWLNPAHGPALLALAEQTGAELVWATTWEYDANRSIGPLIGLPELPVIEVTKGDVEPPGCCSKTPPVAEYVRNRPFVWFDDDLYWEDARYFREHEGVGEFRLVRVEPNYGLCDRHLEKAAEWLTGRRSV
jgi:hypothetical protein